MNCQTPVWSPVFLVYGTGDLLRNEIQATSAHAASVDLDQSSNVKEWWPRLRITNFCGCLRKSARPLIDPLARKKPAACDQFARTTADYVWIVDALGRKKQLADLSI